MSIFNTPQDIFNRACQHLGVRRVLTWGEDTVQFQELYAAYDPIRQAELERNVWTCATTRAILRPLTTTTRLFIPPTYAANISYSQQAIVNFADVDGVTRMWVSIVPDNLGNQPTTNGLPSGFWTPYFGPVSVDTWSPTSNAQGQTEIDLTSITDSSLASLNGYNTGELVYVAPGDGNAFVYSSLTANNTDDPWMVNIWSDGLTYQPFQFVCDTVGGTVYQSLVDLNTGNDPAIVTAAAPWASLTSYSAGQYVLGSDNMIYESLVNSNVGNNPTTDNGTHWTNSIIDSQGNAQTMWGGTWGVVPNSVHGAGSLNWRYHLNAKVAPIFFNFPVSTGPLEDANSLNAFLLPQGWLREARETPKQGVWSFLGAPNRHWPDDWTFDGPFIISATPWPITVRFVCDVTDVGSMDPMLCEGIAASLAKAVWNRIPAKTGELQLIWKVYQSAINDARARNAIEQGPTEPIESHYITSRL